MHRHFISLQLALCLLPPSCPPSLYQLHAQLHRWLRTERFTAEHSRTLHSKWALREHSRTLHTCCSGGGTADGVCDLCNAVGGHAGAAISHSGMLCADFHTDRQTDRQVGRLTDWQTGRLTDRQAESHYTVQAD